ncbi:MAG: LytR C-terminal domain-containing protein [Actinomycetota bacterium]|nr:LytR C-terminal domain-containing protein [Actinomycetota bacterium]
MARKSAAGPLSQPPRGREGATDPTSASARGIILLVVALVLGIFILNKTQGGGATSVSSEPRTTTTKAAKGVTTSTPPNTRAVRQPAAIKVLAANGSGVAGLGGKTGDRLTAAGYNSLAPANTSSDVSASEVEFTPGFDLEATAVAQVLGLPATSVKPLATDIPLADTKGADIVVLVGPDLDASTPGVGTPAAGATTPTTAFTVKPPG